MSVNESMLDKAARRGWCTVADAATYLAVTPATIRRWVHSGDLAGWRVGPKLIRIDVAAARLFRQSVNG